MKGPIRYLTREDAEVMARTVYERTASRGCVEVFGQTWSSRALLAWELQQREMGKDPKVDVRVDELDLSVVYVDVPDPGVGPFKALSRQPSFTDGLSVSELNRLKKAIKDKDLADRLGRLSDEEASKLRIEFYAQLGRVNDLAALKRLTQLQDQLARLRLQNTGVEPPPAPVPEPARPKAKRSRKASAKATSSPASQPGDHVDAPLTQPESPPAAAPAAAAATPSTTTRKPGDLPPRKYPSLNLKRSPT